MQNIEDYVELAAAALDDTYLVQDELGANADEQKWITHKNLFKAVGLYEEVTITTAQLLALNATPIVVLSGLDSSEAFMIDGITVVKPAGVAYAGIDVNEDINLSYTNASGDVLASIETTGLLDSTAKQIRYIRPSTWTTNTHTAALLNETPVAGADVLAHMTTAEIITGDTDLVLKIEYKILDVS